MATLVCFRGLPGSGKTTLALAQQAEHPNNTIRVNRDDTRKRLFGSDSQDYYQCGKDVLWRKEQIVTEANRQTIVSALKAGMDVICDDTNLRVRTCRDLIRLAKATGADWKIEHIDTSLEECLYRNAHRKDKEPVPTEVIEGMYAKFVRGGLAPVSADAPEVSVQDYSDLTPVGSYDPAKRNCYLVDIDGTLAQMTGRSPYDYTRVSEDTPKIDVVRVVETLYNPEAGVDVIVMSGRKSECRIETHAWLMENEIPFTALYMRADGDDRADWKVKYDLFNTHVRDQYNVLGVFDDRNQVVEMWRALGLTCFQVAEGDF